MNILVLGGTGFIGRSLSERFENLDGAVVKAPRRAELNLLDRQACSDYLSDLKPDLVIYSAVNVHSVEESIKTFFNVINSSQSFGQMFHFGSGAEYNPTKYQPLMAESASDWSFPEDGYPLSKFVAGREIEHGPHNNVLNLRLFGIYGEYEDYTRRFIANNICRVLSGLPVSYRKDMNFDYIYVDDLFKVMLQIMDHGTMKHRTYNCCSGNTIRLSQLAAIIKDEMSVGADIIVGEEGFNPEYSGDPSLLEAELGKIQWTPHTEAIRNMITYFESEFEKDDKYRIGS